MTENEKIIKDLKKMDLTNPEVLKLLYNMMMITSDVKLGLELRDYCVKSIKKIKSGDDNKAVEINRIYRKVLLFLAPRDFDSYMIYLEIDRPPHEKFYQPRRKQLKKVVNALQKLADDELDELFLSMPPRVGKTTLVNMFYTWIVGRNSELSNLYSAHSDTITQTFYQGLLEIIQDKNTYRWNEIFPDSEIQRTNADKETINIDRPKRYPSITCRSIDGQLNGACDCNGILCADDLVKGIEEALNPNTLNKLWGKVDNNLITRAKEEAKILWIGTRWSLNDPEGKRISFVENNSKGKKRRYEIINVPALDSNDKSNFEYDYGVGFSSEYYKQRRASFEHNDDMASWLAQYQGEPIERDGVLFSPANMNFYNGTLPDGEPDRIFAFCDVAWGNGDFLSFPIAYQYGDKYFVHDVIFDKSDKKVTRPRVAEKIYKHKVRAATFEKNNGGGEYQEWIERFLAEKYKYTLNITSKTASTHIAKEARIFDNAPDIRELYFIDNAHRSKEYNLFMQNLFSFKIGAKNNHDDAPDSLAGLVNMILKDNAPNVVIMKRPF